MAEEFHALTKAFSELGGLGGNERAMVSTIAKWQKQSQKQKEQLRKGFTPFFTSHGSIKKCEEDHVPHLKTELSRFKNITVLWAMHPSERDARWAHSVLHKAHPYTIIVEIACTRSPEELLDARKAYQALYHRSLEEDVECNVKDNYYNLLFGLVSAYRCEGPKADKKLAKSEAKALRNAIKSAGSTSPLENDKVIKILTTRSKLHLRATFNHYKEIFGKSIEEDLSSVEILKETVKCLDSPPKYFSQVIHKAFKDGADKAAKEALTRVFVSRAEVDMEEIKEAYNKKYEAKLKDVIAKNTHGHYKDVLLSLAGY